MAPTSILERLGVRRQFRQEFILGDARQVTLDMGEIEVELEGKRMHTPCVFGAEGADALLGAVTLEQFGLGVDPIAQRLRPVTGYLVKLRV